MKFTRSAFSLILSIVIIGSMISALNSALPPKPITPAKQDPAQKANDAIGKAFCATNCMINKKALSKRCLVGKKLVRCKRCTGKPTNKDTKMGKVCEMICNANLPASPCDFYGYINNKKKKFDLGLLKKYKIQLLRR